MGPCTSPRTHHRSRQGISALSDPDRQGRGDRTMVWTSLGRLLGSALLLFAVIGIATPLAAAPHASLVYVETALSGGDFQYDYTLSNLSNAVADAGFDIFDVVLLHPAATFSVIALPPGWDAIAGLQLAESFSLNSGMPPSGTDLPPGTVLSG